MVTRLSPSSAISQSRLIARGAGCFVVENKTPKGFSWSLYRDMGRFGRRCYVGRRSDAVAFFRFVNSVCTSKGVKS